MANDVSRLVLQVDANIELARQGLANLLRSTEETANKVETNLAKIDRAHNNTGQGIGSMRNGLMEAQHSIRAFGDSVAAGQDPMRAFVMELGRIGQAVEGLGQSGGLGKFGAFLGGPWGLALSAGIGLLTSFGGEFFKSGDKVAEETEKLKKNAAETKVAEQAKAAFERTADGAAAAIHRETAELDKQNRSLMDNARAQIASLEAKRAAVVTERGQIPIKEALAQRDADNARRALAAAEAMPASGKAGFEARGAAIQSASADLKNALATVASLQGQAVAYDKALAEADRGIRDALLPVIDRRVEANNDPTKHATVEFENAMDRLHARFRAGAITLEAYTLEENRLADIRDKAIEATKKHKGPNPASVEQDAESAATRAAYMKRWLQEALPGVDVTSTTNHRKYTAGGKVSEHYTGNAIDFVPPGGVGSMTKDEVRKLFESAGFRVSHGSSGVEQIFGPWMGTGTALGRQHQNHIHVGYEGTPPKPGTVEHRLEAAAEKAARDREAYEQLLLRADEELANATHGRATTAQEAEALADEDIDLERRRRQSAVQAMVDEKRITQAQADVLTEKYRQVASAKTRTAAEMATQRVIEEQAEHERVMLSGMVTLLRLQEGLAATNAERKRIALSILDYEERTARAALHVAIDAERKKPKPDQARIDDLKTQLGQIDAQHGLKVAQIDRANESPMQRYQRELNEGLGDVHNRLEDIEVQGLKGLESDLASAATKALHLSGALGDVANALIRIGLEKGLQALFGLLGMGGGGNGFSDFVNNPVASLGSGPGLNSLFSGLGFAAGGEPPLGKASLVGERGPELFVPKQPGIIIPNHALRGGGGAANDTLTVVVAASEDFDVRVERTAARHVAAAAPGIAGAAAKTTIRTLTRPRL